MKITPLIATASVIALVISSNGDASQIINWIGSYKSSATPWEVTVNEDKPPEFSFQTGVTISSLGWLPHKGWFVLIQDDKRLWAFDGLDKLLLLEINKMESKLFEFDTKTDFNSLPYLPPTDVLNHLPQTYREKIERKFKKTET
jgi:hypothetical protein